MNRKEFLLLFLAPVLLLKKKPIKKVMQLRISLTDPLPLPTAYYTFDKKNGIVTVHHSFSIRNSSSS